MPRKLLEKVMLLHTLKAARESERGDEADGKSPYGYIEQDPLDASFFFNGMAAALPFPGAAAPAGGHPPGTPPNAQRVALLSRANRRKKTLAAFITAHVTDQNLKTMLQNQAAGDGGRMWQLLRQHCYRPINDLTMHDLKDKISGLFDRNHFGGLVYDTRARTQTACWARPWALSRRISEARLTGPIPLTTMVFFLISDEKVTEANPSA